MTTGKAAGLVVVVALALAGCGSDPPKGAGTSGGGTTSVPGGTGSARSATGTATTANGSYRITLAVGDRSPGGTATVCAPGAAPGKSSLSVVVTVVNADNGRAVPFPPLRVELNAGGSPAPVPVRDSSGTCSFTPHDGALDPGASATLPGATPAIDDNAAPGSAGRVEVAISENDFTLGLPVP